MEDQSNQNTHSRSCRTGKARAFPVTSGRDAKINKNPLKRKLDNAEDALNGRKRKQKKEEGKEST